MSSGLIKNRSQWWGTDERSGKRVLFREPGSENRTATTQELFYDLVFVAVIAKLVHLFAADHTKWLEFLGNANPYPPPLPLQP